MTARIRLGLPVSLGLVVLTIEAIVLLMLGSYFLNRFSAEVDRRLQESIARPSLLLGQGALSTDAFGQRDTLEKLVGPALDEALIVTASGVVLVALDPELIGQPWEQSAPRSKDWLTRAVAGGFTERIAEGTNSFLIRVAPVNVAAGQAPALFDYVRLRTTESEGELASLRGFIIGGSLAAFLVTTMALLIAAHLLVTRRLQKVAGAVGLVTEGQYVTHLPEVGPRDEITFLSAGFNTMIQRLRESFDRHRQAVAVAEAAEAKYRTLVENAAEAIFVAQDGRFVFANVQCCRLFECSHEEALRSSVTRFVHPEDQSLIAERHAQRIRGESPPSRYEFRLLSARGRLIWGDLNVVLIDWHGAPATLNFLSDITERKLAEESIRLSQTQLLASLENTPNVAIQWYDEGGKVLYWNPASERLYGWKSAEALGKTLDQLIHTPEETAEFLKLIRGIQQDGRPAGPYEAAIRRADGSRGWVLATTFSIPLGGGRPGFVCMDMDITDRKQAEQDRERLQAQLIQAQKMESVGRLAGGVAHDFNNMLQAILGNVDLARTLPPTDPSVRECLAEISNSARRSADLTRQLLAFARKQTIAPQVVDLNELIAKLLVMLRRLLGEHIELDFRAGAHLWPTQIDPSQVDQILTNLCLNARDAINGSGRISIETVNARFDESHATSHPGFSPGDYAVLQISDTGAGMDAATRTQIFEPFFTTKEVGKGTGLGLATVFGIVKQNHGHIHVDSEPGQGTTFKIYLPRSLEGPTPAEPAVASDEVAGRETILLVEDEPQVLSLGRRILARNGYHVLGAANPEAALELAAQHGTGIQLLITDVIMPGMNGRLLRDQLRRQHPALKCLFMSGYTADVVGQHGILDDGIHFVQKPFTIETFCTKVREVLDA